MEADSGCSHASSLLIRCCVLGKERREGIAEESLAVHPVIMSCSLDVDDDDDTECEAETRAEGHPDEVKKMKVAAAEKRDGGGIIPSFF